MSLVLVRIPTYRRPELLKRAVRCLQVQTHQDWVCEVRDDCPDSSARDVVEELADPRIYYTANQPQKFLVRNLDDCFRCENPFGADYFFMLEDDNQVRPEFMARGIEITRQAGVSLCQMNQVIAYNTGTPEESTEDAGIFDGIYDERVYQPEELRLALLGGIGISNGAVFWSRNIRTELAFRMDTIPALDEYLRTCLVNESIYISRDKLAVWAKNEQSTTRNLGFDKGRLRREIDLKASIRALQRAIWRGTSAKLREDFINGGVLRIPMASRYEAFAKADIAVPGFSPSIGLKDRIKKRVVRHLGNEHPSVSVCLKRAVSGK